MPGPGRPGLNEKSCQIDMNRLNLFSIGDFSSWSLLYPLKKLFFQYHHNNFEKWGPKFRWFPLELGKKHKLTYVGSHFTTLGGQIGSKIIIFDNLSLPLFITYKIALSLWIWWKLVEYLALSTYMSSWLWLAQLSAFWWPNDGFFWNF